MGAMFTISTLFPPPRVICGDTRGRERTRGLLIRTIINLTYMTKVETRGDTSIWQARAGAAIEGR